MTAKGLLALSTPLLPWVISYRHTQEPNRLACVGLHAILLESGTSATCEGIGTWKYAFNAFQSSCRVEVEGAFGALVKRWAVLQESLKV